LFTIIRAYKKQFGSIAGLDRTASVNVRMPIMQDVVYSTLSAVFNLTCAAVPVLPLVGKKWRTQPLLETTRVTSSATWSNPILERE
jgi:hypothetical protein